MKEAKVSLVVVGMADKWGSTASGVKADGGVYNISSADPLCVDMGGNLT